MAEAFGREDVSAAGRAGFRTSLGGRHHADARLLGGRWLAIFGFIHSGIGGNDDVAAALSCTVGQGSQYDRQGD